MQPTITFIPKARAVLTIFQPSRMPVHFISLMFMPVKAPMMPRMSASLCMLSSQRRIILTLRIRQLAVERSLKPIRLPIIGRQAHQQNSFRSVPHRERRV